MLAYYRLVINHKDDEALLRIVNFPARGIGKTTIEKLIVVADQHKKSISEVIDNPAQFPVQLSDGTYGKLATFLTMIKSFSAQLETKNAFDLAKHIAVSTGLLKELYEDKTPEGVSRFENIEELLNAIKEFTENAPAAAPLNELPLLPEPGDNGNPPTETLSEVEQLKTLGMFMQDVALLTDQDSKENENDDRVTLMTIHAAKGLEFPYVFVVGMEMFFFATRYSCVLPGAGAESPIRMPSIFKR